MDAPSPKIRVGEINYSGRSLLNEFFKRHQLSRVLKKREIMFLSNGIPSQLEYLAFFWTTIFYTKRFEIYKRGIFKSLIPLSLKLFFEKNT